jgi:hypothetical protein
MKDDKNDKTHSDKANTFVRREEYSGISWWY